MECSISTVLRTWKGFLLLSKIVYKRQRVWTPQSGASCIWLCWVTSHPLRGDILLATSCFVKRIFLKRWFKWSFFVSSFDAMLICFFSGDGLNILSSWDKYSWSNYQCFSSKERLWWHGCVQFHREQFVWCHYRVCV